MYSPSAADAGAWPANAAYMLQMVQVPVFGGPQGQGYSQADPRQMGMSGGYFPASPTGVGDLDGVGPGIKYGSDNIVLAAGQYREVRPTISHSLLAGGACHFRCEPADLPAGLNFDSSSGTIWGTPATPPADADAAGPYTPYRVIVSGPHGSASVTVGLKVVHFQPQSFRITHVSQLERGKYMVLIDTRKKQH